MSVLYLFNKGKKKTVEKFDNAADADIKKQINHLKLTLKDATDTVSKLKTLADNLNAEATSGNSNKKSNGDVLAEAFRNRLIEKSKAKAKEAVDNKAKDDANNKLAKKKPGVVDKFKTIVEEGDADEGAEKANAKKRTNTVSHDADTDGETDAETDDGETDGEEDVPKKKPYVKEGFVNLRQTPNKMRPRYNNQNKKSQEDDVVQEGFTGVTSAYSNKYLLLDD